ncbi:MAG: hypothetical protein ACKOPQ_08755 [Novosphingobium sp.]
MVGLVRNFPAKVSRSQKIHLSGELTMQNATPINLVVPALALIVSSLSAPAVAQTQPVRIGQPGTAVAADPSIAQLRAELAALKAEVASLKAAVAAQENARKALAAQHFSVAGKVSGLSKDFYSHQHHQNFLSVSNVMGGGVNTSVGVMQVSPPVSTCVSKTPTPGKAPGALRWDDRYACTPPAP